MTAGSRSGRRSVPPIAVMSGGLRASLSGLGFDSEEPTIPSVKGAEQPVHMACEGRVCTE
jgi:hypothetical protein